MAEWPKDWPEDKKTGPGFLQELMRRHPDQVKTGTLEEAAKEIFEDDATRGPTQPG